VSHTRRVIETTPGYRSAEAALFVAQMDDQSRRLNADTRGLTPAALAWQHGTGTNTIGMLLAHIAIAEVAWVQVGIEGLGQGDTLAVLGVGPDDDGMPLAPGGAPPATLRGRDLAFFDDLLARARAHTVRVARALDPEALAAQRVLTDDDGASLTTHPRWVLYHLLEHLAGHYGQGNLLRHLHRLAHPEAGAGVPAAAETT